MQLYRTVRQMVLTTALSAALAALQVVSRKLALDADERRVLVERVEATLMAG